MQVASTELAGAMWMLLKELVENMKCTVDTYGCSVGPETCIVEGATVISISLDYESSKNGESIPSCYDYRSHASIQSFISIRPSDQCPPIMLITPR